MANIVHTRSWDETRPGVAEATNTLHAILQSFKVDVRERMEVERFWNSATDSGRNEEGSARVSVGLHAALPVARSVGAIDGAAGNEEGRCYYSTNRNELRVSDGTSWLTLGLFPLGGVVMWSGLASAIPSGWALCNGLLGTPNLSGRFIVGYSASDTDYDVGDTGGAKTVTLIEANLCQHTHNVSGQGAVNADNGVPIKGFLSDSSGNDPHLAYKATTGGSGISQPFGKRPPYYALCYIMKLSA